MSSTYRHAALCLLAAALLTGCAAKIPQADYLPRARSIERSCVECFEKRLVSHKSRPVQCEASASAFTGDAMIIGSYKPVPGADKSSVMSLPCTGGQLSGPLTYLLASYEEENTDEGLGGCLWTLPMAAVENGCAPSLLLQCSGS